MSKVGRLWDWLLPGLISLSPIGAIAYYNAGVEKTGKHRESLHSELRAADAVALPGTLAIPLARL